MLRAAGRAALSTAPLVALRTHTEPFLRPWALSALCVGAPTALWMVNSGFALIANVMGPGALIVAPAGVVLTTGAAALAGLDFEERLAALPTAERAASDAHVRDLLYATLIVGGGFAAGSYTPLAPEHRDP